MQILLLAFHIYCAAINLTTNEWVSWFLGGFQLCELIDTSSFRPCMRKTWHCRCGYVMSVAFHKLKQKIWKIQRMAFWSCLASKSFVLCLPRHIEAVSWLEGWRMLVHWVGLQIKWEKYSALYIEIPPKPSESTNPLKRQTRGKCWLWSYWLCW